MKEKTRTRFVVGLCIVIFVFIMIYMTFIVCERVKAEDLEIPINQFPFWAVSISGDSTFQTVQILKCYEIYPNGQRELLGYMVAVDSSGVRIYEEEPKYFLNWAIRWALRLQAELGKKGR